MGCFFSFIQTKPGLSQNIDCQEQFRLQLQNWHFKTETFIQDTEKELLFGLVPSKYVVTSEGIDKEAFFDPADDKLYRHPLLLPNS